MSRLSADDLALVLSALCDNCHEDAELLREHIDSLEVELAELRAGLDGGGEHIIEFRIEGWTIKHPLACRPNLFECPVNRATEEAVGKPARLGRFPCWLDAEGNLVWDEEDPR